MIYCVSLAFSSLLEYKGSKHVIKCTNAELCDCVQSELNALGNLNARVCLSAATILSCSGSQPSGTHLWMLKRQKTCELVTC